MSGQLGLAVPNYMTASDLVIYRGGGDWELYTLPDGTQRGSLDNLSAEFFTEEAVSATAATADTQFEFDMGLDLPFQFFGIAKGNTQAGGTIRVRGSSTLAWSGCTVNGVTAINATSISFHNASGASITFVAGQIFTISGMAKVYQITSGATITNGSNGSIAIKRVDKTGTGLEAATIGSEAITCRSGNYTTPTLDTGILFYPMSATPTTGWRILTLPNTFSYEFDTVKTARYLKWEIINSDNPSGEISLAGLHMGPVQYPPYNMDYGARFGIKSNSQRESSAGGATALQKEATQRTLKFQLSAIPEATAFTTIFDMLNETDIGNLWVFYDSSDSALKTRRSFPATFDDLSELQHSFMDGLDITLSLTERVA